MEPNPAMTQTSRGDADTPPNPEKPKSNRTRAGNLTNDNKKWHIKKQIDQWKKKKKKWKKKGYDVIPIISTDCAAQYPLGGA